MMELLKKNIHMNRQKGIVTSQITLDDDFIVPDTMDDVEQMILTDGEIQVESSKTQGEKVAVKGKLAFWVLYRKAEGGLQTLAGSIPFEESINVPELDEKDYVQLSSSLEDLNTGIINSRKLSMKAIVTLEVRVDSLVDAQAAVEVDADDVAVEVLKRSVDVAAIAVRRKDTLRIKEGIQVSGNKPNIENILWQEMKLRGVNSKPLDGKVHVDGELMIFVIYSSEGENAPVQWVEESIPFSGDIDLPDAIEEMVPAINVRLIHKEIEAKPDYDGEMRELEIDAVIELDMKLYEEQNIELLSDLYATNRELVLDTGEACFDKLIAKNVCKCKVAEKLELQNPERILQICHSEGIVKIDETEVKEDGLHVDGILEVSLLYLTADDAQPIGSSTEIVPFHCMVEAAGMDENTIYQLNSGMEQMTAVMLGGDSVEVKAVVTLDLLALQPVCESVILSAQVEPLDLQKLQQMPGIVGYIVQPGDPLWKIAKKFHTTVDTVMGANGMTERQVKPGDRLILIKSIES